MIGLLIFNKSRLRETAGFVLSCEKIINKSDPKIVHWSSGVE